MSHLNSLYASQYSEIYSVQVQGRLSLSVAACKMLREEG